jgi:hypothetical protein
MRFTTYTERSGTEIIDTEISRAEALAQNPAFEPYPVSELEVLDVKTWGLVEYPRPVEHVGKIVVNELIVDTIEAFFYEAYKMGFPMGLVIPAADTRYQDVDADGVSYTGLCWNDRRMMEAEIVSGQNNRTIIGSDKRSKHDAGLAIDVNTRRNWYQRRLSNGRVVIEPHNFITNENVPGRLYPGHPLVKFMLKREMVSGSLWSLETDGVIDAQHFGYQEY